MTKQPTQLPDYPAIAEIDYSYYIRRGRQEQARAVHAAFTGLFRWAKNALAGNKQHVHKPSAASANPRHA